VTHTADIEEPIISGVSRKFWAILGLSVLLHATLFAVTSWQRKHGPVSLPPILASIRLINVSPSEPVAAAAESPAPAAVPQKARQTPTRVEQRSAPHVTQTAGPAIVPAPASSPSVSAPGESLASAAAPSAPAESVRPAPVVAAQRPQSEVLEGYRQRLSELFARHQEYPRVAAMRGWEGEVRLRLKVARKGNLLGVVLDHSSGFDVLDQHAMAMLEAMASLPPLPDALEANEISVVVPINYKLKKTT
jgi:periplasmic protein TonB